MKHFKIFFSILLLLSSLGLAAQTNESQIFKKVLKNTTLVDTFYSNFYVGANGVVAPNNCTVSINPTAVSPKHYQVTIIPNVNFVGKAEAFIPYLETGNKIKFLTYHLDVVESIITTQPDFVMATLGSSTSIFPLANDISSASGLSLVGLANVGLGTTVVQGDSIVYTPVDTNNEYLVYGVTNSAGTKATGKIYILHEDLGANAVDTLDYTIVNSQEQLIILPFGGLSLDANHTPSLGVVTILHPMVLSYKANHGISGVDQFEFNDGLGNVRVIRIKILSQVTNKSSVRDDVFYTSKNKSITFDVLANDLSQNYAISNISPGLTHDTLGVFSYTPPYNFSGVKNFTYTVNYGGGNKAVGNIVIKVGNFEPQSLDYGFKTDKNTSLVLEYNMPISSYHFNVLNDGQFGSVEIFSDTTTLQIDCNEINSKATLVYTPDNDYYGQDEFDIEYCVENNPCIVYKVYVDVIESDQDSLCKCVGKDCVWAGDMNGDGRVSITDLLSLGRYVGLSGPFRTDLPYGYLAGQHSDDWSYIQNSGFNAKHIDANGDGFISVDDTLALSDHYSLIHNLVPTEVLAVKEYPFQLVPNATSVDSGDLLVIDIVIGTTNTPALNVYGLAFAMNLDPAIIDSSSFQTVFYNDSWLTKGGSFLQMVKQPQEGVLHIGCTRMDGIVEDEAEGLRPSGNNGDGIIGQLSFIVEDEAEGLKIKDKVLTRRISVSNIECMDGNGEKFLLPETYIDIQINRNQSEPVPSEEKLLVYPNPANQAVNLYFNGRNIIKAYKMSDLYGNIVMANNDVNTQSVSIDSSVLPSGVYTIQVVTTEGVLTKKIEVLKK